MSHSPKFRGASKARPLACLLTAACALALPVAATADGGDSAAQALDALQAVPSLVQDSATVPTTSTSDSAVATSDGATTVDVPADPSDPVSLTTANGASVAIGIPEGDGAANAVPVGNGIVAYDGAATATLFVAQVVPAGTDMTPAASDDGSSPADTSAPASDPATGMGVRLITVIQSADAPADFSFPVTVPFGGSIVAQDDGGYAILDANGATIAVINAPWARDANNVPVPVTLTLDGTTLNMHVDASGATFPVTADPDLTSCIKPGPSGTAARRSAVVAAAMRFNHTKYVWAGGNSCGPTGGGFDCSGLMQYAYAQIGLAIPRYSGRGGDFSTGTPVNPTVASLQPGDLVFYLGDGSSSDPHHVGMYIGNGQVVQAMSSRLGVGVWSLTFGVPVGARRLIP